MSRSQIEARAPPIFTLGKVITSKNSGDQQHENSEHLPAIFFSLRLDLLLLSALFLLDNRGIRKAR
jgi:hypothetical protein